MKLNVISPTRGGKYMLANVLAKGLDRRGIDWISVHAKLQHQCFYESKDIVVHCNFIESMESQWNNSVNFRIVGLIPIHQTKDGKISIGFGCGCDRDHYGQSPSSAPPSNNNWDEYKNQELGKILVWTDILQTTVRIEEMLHDKESCNILVRILQQIFAEEFLESVL